MQWLAKISILRPVFAAVLILTLCVAGIYSYFQLGIDQFPNVDVPTITVTTTLPGASPDEMDSSVTEEIEKQVNTISSIDSISSVSSEGTSVVTIQFLLNKSTDVAFSEVQSKVNLAIPNLPTNINQPTVQKLSTDSGAVFSFALTAEGENIRDITEYADKTLRPQIESVSGVGQATIIGGRLRQMNVTLDPERLLAYDLTAVGVKNALQAENVEVPGGSLEGRDDRVSVRTMGRFKSAKELGDMVVAQQNGQPIHLRDLGQVNDGAVEADTIATVNGKNTVVISVQKQSGSNTIAVIRALKEKLSEIQKTLPRGNSIQVTRDQSVFIQASVDTVEEHLLLGSVLAAIVVLVFLWDWRSTVISSLAIPSSIVATFALIYAMGFTLNTITLLALTLAVGIVIDDAILVLENIVRFMKDKNQSPRRAAAEATQEIGLAVLATTLSLVAIFLPIAFMSGILGRFLTSFGLTMAFAILISLLVAFTLTPMLSSRWLKGSADSQKAEGEAGYVAPKEDIHLNLGVRNYSEPPETAGKRGLYHKIETGYWHLVRWALRHRWIVVVGCIALFFSIIPLGLRVNKGFLPDDDQSQFITTVRAPEGTSLQATGRLIEGIAEKIRKLPDVRFTAVTIGSDAQSTRNKGDILVQMKEIKDRTSQETQFTLMQRVRSEIAAAYPKDVRITVASPATIGGGSGQSDIQYIVSGPDLQKLGEISDKMVAGIKKISGVTDVDTSATNGDPELRVQLLRKQAADLGVSASDIATTTEIVVAGLHVSDFSENGHRYDVNLRADPNYRKDAEGLALFTVPSTTSGSGTVHLNQVSTFERSTAPASINRYARSRQVTFSVNIEKGASQSAVQSQIESLFKSLNEGPEYTGQPGGFSKEQAKAFGSFGTAIMLSFVFVYLILAAQFESWLHPITILFSLPLCVPFALISMIVMGVSINIFSMLGILVLFGVVKKNSILQVDHANQLRAAGLNREEAVLEASRDRLRPILMTTCAFVAGMLPLAFSKGVGADTNHSAGDVVIGGQTLSLLLTLVATPVLYTLMDDLSISIAKSKKKLAALLIRRPTLASEDA